MQSAGLGSCSVGHASPRRGPHTCVAGGTSTRAEERGRRWAPPGRDPTAHVCPTQKALAPESPQETQWAPLLHPWLRGVSDRGPAAQFSQLALRPYAPAPVSSPQGTHALSEPPPSAHDRPRHPRAGTPGLLGFGFCTVCFQGRHGLPRAGTASAPGASGINTCLHSRAGREAQLCTAATAATAATENPVGKDAHRPGPRVGWADTRPQQGPRSSWGRRPEGGGLPPGSCWLPLESSRKEGAAGHAAEDEVSPAGCNQTAESAACSELWRTPGLCCPNSMSSLLGEINALLRWQRRHSCCSPPHPICFGQSSAAESSPASRPPQPAHVPAPRAPGRPPATVPGPGSRVPGSAEGDWRRGIPRTEPGPRRTNEDDRRLASQWP